MILVLREVQEHLALAQAEEVEVGHQAVVAHKDLRRALEATGQAHRLEEGLPAPLALTAVTLVAHPDQVVLVLALEVEEAPLALAAPKQEGLGHLGLVVRLDLDLEAQAHLLLMVGSDHRRVVEVLARQLAMAHRVVAMGVLALEMASVMVRALAIITVLALEMVIVLGPVVALVLGSVVATVPGWATTIVPDSEAGIVLGLAVEITLVAALVLVMVPALALEMALARVTALMGTALVKLQDSTVRPASDLRIARAPIPPAPTLQLAPLVCHQETVSPLPAVHLRQVRRRRRRLGRLRKARSSEQSMGKRRFLIARAAKKMVASVYLRVMDMVLYMYLEVDRDIPLQLQTRKPR